MPANARGSAVSLFSPLARRRRPVRADRGPLAFAHPPIGTLSLLDRLVARFDSSTCGCVRIIFDTSMARVGRGESFPAVPHNCSRLARRANFCRPASPKPKVIHGRWRVSRKFDRRRRCRARLSL